MKNLGYLTALLLLAMLSWLIGGWTLAVLWGWFIVPIFAVPSLTWSQAAGVSTVVSFLIIRYEKNDPTKTNAEKIAQALGWIVAKSLVFLGFGWVLHLFLK